MGWGPGRGGHACEAELSPRKPYSGPSLGCWCPTGQVLDSGGHCTWPGECLCLVDSVYDWPRQHIKVDCQLCICQDGRPQHCQPNLRGPWSPRTPSQVPNPLLAPATWSFLSELWLVILVPLGQVPGALWEPECSVVFLEPQQPLPLWPRLPVPRHSLQSPRDLQGPNPSPPAAC